MRRPKQSLGPLGRVSIASRQEISIYRKNDFLGFAYNLRSTLRLASHLAE